MHISYERDVDALLDGTSGMLLERIMRESGLRWDDDRGAFCLDTALDRLPEAVFAFGQALTRVYDLASFSRLSADSKFYETLTAFLISIVDESLVKRNYFPEVPNAECYPVDYCIEIEGEKRDPLFLYGVPNQDKARLTTIILSHFHRHNLHFESLLVFEDQAKVSRMDLVRLSDVGGDMISSLESREDITREVLRRVAS